MAKHRWVRIGVPIIPLRTPGDADSDGIDDEENPCTLLLAWVPAFSKAKLSASRLDAEPAAQKLTFKESFVPAGLTPVEPELNA